MRKLYKVAKHNSTVCGYPGREFDWSKFGWEGEEIYKSRFNGDIKAPLPFTDNGLIANNCEYLHVPYNFTEHGTIYRVRPNPTMYAGEIYRGKLIKNQKAIKRDGVWYWQLEFGEGR